jgi:phosphopantothenoylcysteine decarboxylase/phosphopantothenate--cysteine ligase
MGLTAVLTGKRVLLIVSGGIAAYKSLELIRRLTEKDAAAAAAPHSRTREPGPGEALT